MGVKSTSNQTFVQSNSPFGGKTAATTPTEKEMVNELKMQWKKLWQERVDDKVRAEGIAVADYTTLFVDKGTIIHATRDFKPLNFKEILEQHKIENTDRFIQPTPHIGGWNKFIKTLIASQKPQRNRRAEAYRNEKKAIQLRQPKKSGRGWLHL
jgi:TorA maturation chaperone TorD